MISSSAFEQRLLEFAWNEWAQLGLSSRVDSPSPWCQDPEALIAFTLRLARRDPRLFDELLDWLVANHGEIVTRRLDTLAVEPEARRLVRAARAWAGRRGPRAARAAAPSPAPATQSPEPLFPAFTFLAHDPDPDFLSQGFELGTRSPSGKSATVDPHRPIAFAFRLRRLLGVGVRAEIVRAMLTVDAPGQGAAALTMASAYSRRNVREALDSLDEAGSLEVVRRGSDTRYAVDRGAWASVLGLEVDDLPIHRDWVQLLPAALTLLEWLEQRETDERSEFLRAGSALDVLDAIRPGLTFAGVPVPRPVAEGAELAARRAGDAVLAALAA